MELETVTVQRVDCTDGYFCGLYTEGIRPSQPSLDKLLGRVITDQVPGNNNFVFYQFLEEEMLIRVVAQQPILGRKRGQGVQNLSLVVAGRNGFSIFDELNYLVHKLNIQERTNEFSYQHHQLEIARALLHSTVVEYRSFWLSHFS